MNEAQASVLRTAVKCAAVIILFNGWPKIRKSHVFNQTVIQPSQADDLVMRSVILQLHEKQNEVEDYVYFERTDRGLKNERTDGYYMPRSEWEEAGRPDSISITVSNLVDGVSV